MDYRNRRRIKAWAMILSALAGGAKLAMFIIQNWPW